MTAERELAALEATVLSKSGAAAWLSIVDKLRAMLASGKGDVRAIILSLSNPSVEASAIVATVEAYRLGSVDALKVVGKQGARVRGKPSAAALKLVKGLDKGGRMALAQAKTLARVASADDATALAPLFGHANRVRGSVSDSINMGGNEGSARVAHSAGLPLVWVAETDACVVCLAYSGRVVARGEKFPGGLTYGAKSYQPDAIDTPPRHPNCRCTIEPLNDQEYADALRREADRSVLRGFSLESESMGTRIDAAERLVDNTDLVAPKSVISYAKSSVKRGEFATRGRPKGTPPPPNKPKTPPAKVR